MRLQKELSYVEQCLIEWAEWSSDGRPVPGSPCRTVEDKLMKEGPAAGMASGYSSLEMTETVARVERALLSLPKDQLAVIKKKYLWVNLSDEARARMLKMNRYTFYRELDRARWYLKGQLDRQSKIK